MYIDYVIVLISLLFSASCHFHIEKSKDYLKIQSLALQNKKLKEIEKWHQRIRPTYYYINDR